nr:hypothetical protein [Tanacetum cinerariifolium]
MFMEEIMKIHTEFREEVSTLHQIIKDLQADEARAVDDFLWEIEQYLEGVNVMDDAS